MARGPTPELLAFSSQFSSSSSADVVIAYFDDHDKVEASSGSMSYLPAVRSKDEAKNVEEDHKKVMVDD